MYKTFVRFDRPGGHGEVMVDPASVVAIEPDGQIAKIHIVGITGALSIDCNYEKAARRIIKGVDYMRLRNEAETAREALASGEEE